MKKIIIALVGFLFVLDFLSHAGEESISKRDCGLVYSSECSLVQLHGAELQSSLIQDETEQDIAQVVRYNKKATKKNLWMLTDDSTEWKEIVCVGPKSGLGLVHYTYKADDAVSEVVQTDIIGIPAYEESDSYVPSGKAIKESIIVEGTEITEWSDDKHISFYWHIRGVNYYVRYDNCESSFAENEVIALIKKSLTIN